MQQDDWVLQLIQDILFALLALALANMAHSFNSLVFLYKPKTNHALTNFDESFSSRDFLMEKHKLLSLGSNFGLQSLNKSYSLIS